MFWFSIHFRFRLCRWWWSCFPLISSNTRWRIRWLFLQEDELQVDSSLALEKNVVADKLTQKQDTRDVLMGELEKDEDALAEAKKALKGFEKQATSVDNDIAAKEATKTEVFPFILLHLFFQKHLQLAHLVVT